MEEVGQTQNHKAELGYRDGGTAERRGGRTGEDFFKNFKGKLQKEGKGEGGLKRYTDGGKAEGGGSRKTFKKRGV